MFMKPMLFTLLAVACLFILPANRNEAEDTAVKQSRTLSRVSENREPSRRFVQWQGRQAPGPLADRLVPAFDSGPQVLTPTQQ